MLIHDYEKMPNLYARIYAEVNSCDGKEMHKIITKTLKMLRKGTWDTDFMPTYNRDRDRKLINYVKRGVSKKQMELIKSFLKYKYSPSDIYPEYEKFLRYIGRTKVSTDRVLRKHIYSITQTAFRHALNKEEYNKLKELFDEINIKEIAKEISELDEKEMERNAGFLKEKPLRTKNGKAINRELLEIAPDIVDEASKKVNFFTNLKFNENEIGFFVKNSYGKNREIVNVYLKESAKTVKIDLEFETEDDNNYFVVFDRKQSFEIGFVYRTLLSNVMEGLTILGIPIHIIIGNCSCNGMEIHRLLYRDLTFNEYHKSIREGLYIFNVNPFYMGNPINIISDDSVRFVIEKLVSDLKLKSEIHLACYLHYNYVLPIQDYVKQRQKYVVDNGLSPGDIEYKEKKNEVYNKLVANGEISSKWKSEAELYKLIKKHYPDATFQYMSPWLDRQSLDIYVPSIKTAFEFQGRQHYEPIEYFGGEEAFIYRQQLDLIKKQKCSANDVRLIEWHYQDLITKTNLNRKLREKAT